MLSVLGLDVCDTVARSVDFDILGKLVVGCDVVPTDEFNPMDSVLSWREDAESELELAMVRTENSGASARLHFDIGEPN